MKNIDQGISETIECDVSRLCLVAGVEERSGVKVKKEGKKGKSPIKKSMVKLIFFPFKITKEF